MPVRERNLFSPFELSVLRSLDINEHAEKLEKSTKTELLVREIREISSSTGIGDSDEILRALYTLEGKNLVEPFPKGDFTSQQWRITQVGLKALEMVAN